MTRKTNIQTIKKIIGYSFVFIILGYGIFTARDTLFGVQISLDKKNTVFTAKEPIYHLSGKVNHAEEFHMNGLPLSVNDDGSFNEVVILSPGYNKISLFAKNKFDRTDEVDLEIVLE